MVRLRSERAEGVERVGFAELLFDVVFVFAITQLSHLLLGDLTLEGAGETALLLLAVWFTWTHLSWMTNWTDPEAAPLRLFLLAAMVVCMLMAIAIPEAFGDRGLVFASSYVALRLGVVAVALLAARARPLRLEALALWNVFVGAIWLTGGVLDDSARTVTWAIALLVDLGGPFADYRLPGLGRFRWHDIEIVPGHFAERYQLFIIVALGESIVLTGATAAELELTATRVEAIAVAVLVTGALWWLYFGGGERRGEAALARAGPGRAHLARDAYTYLHIPIVAGILVVAVVDELVIEHPGYELEDAGLTALAAGPVLYLLGSAALVYRVAGSASWRRPVAAVAVGAAALLGAVVPALAAWALVLAILAGVAAGDTRARRRR